MIGDTIYVTWQENRSSGTATSSMVQKLDTAGNIGWVKGGIVAGTTNYYYAYPKVAASDSGTVVNSFQGLADNQALTIQRIRPNGSLTWPGNGKVLSSTPGACDQCGRLVYWEM